MFAIPDNINKIRIHHFDKRSNGPAPYHQIVLPDGVWLNIFENGQVTVNTYDNDIRVTGLRNHKGGSNVYMTIAPKVRHDPEADEGDLEEEDEADEVLDLSARD